MHSHRSTDLTDPRLDDRVRRHTRSRVNARIDHRTQASLAENSHAGREAVLARIKALDREWDVDRALMANFAILGGLSFAFAERRRGMNPWRVLFGSQLGFLLMHSVVGWCPPLPVFRRLGFRTSREISAERTALVAQLVGLYRSMPGPEEDAVSPAAKPWAPDLPERSAEADRES